MPDATCKNTLHRDINALHTQAWFSSSCSHTIPRDRASEFILNTNQTHLMPPTMHRPECPQGLAFAVKLVYNALSLGSSALGSLAHTDTGVILTACTAQLKLAWSLLSICCPASLALLTMSASMPASLATCKHSILGTWRRRDTHTHTHTHGQNQVQAVCVTNARQDASKSSASGWQ